MGKDFTVDIGAVELTATKFMNLSGEYKALMSAAGFVSPSTGDGDVDAVLDTALRTMGELHLMLAQAIFQHGEKLGLAAGNVSSAEHDLSQVMDKIFYGALNDPTPPPHVGPDSPFNFGGNQGG